MTPRLRLLTVLLPLGVMVGCAPVPDFSAGSVADAPFPKIVPVDQIKGQVPPQTGDEGISALAARAADLRARAAALRGTPVLDDTSEEELQDAVDPS